MATIQVDFSTPVGAVKPMHGVGQPPFEDSVFGMDYSHFRYLRQAHVPFSRLHDVGGFMGGGGRFVDIPNLFPNFDADPADPASYTFEFTDTLITALVESGVEPFFRLGVTIENQCNIRRFQIDPPKDPMQWARICEGVIRHYTEGWANGFHYPIRYWEIWNEPENDDRMEYNQMWHGTKEQFFELYDVTSHHLKQCFPHLKIGGYASCGFYALDGRMSRDAAVNARFDYLIEFFDAFLIYIKEHGCPLDFFSWHSYGDIESTCRYQEYARKRLDEAGYAETEITLNEWNIDPQNLYGTQRHAALIGGMMLALHEGSLDSAMFYDSRLGASVYGSLFNPMTKRPYPAYYAFKAFGELYSRGTQVKTSCDLPGLYVMAAGTPEDGCIMMVNTTGKNQGFSLQVDGTVTGYAMLDNLHSLEEVGAPGFIPTDGILCVYVKK